MKVEIVRRPDDRYVASIEFVSMDTLLEWLIEHGFKGGGTIKLGESMFDVKKEDA